MFSLHDDWSIRVNKIVLFNIIPDLPCPRTLTKDQYVCTIHEVKKDSIYISVKEKNINICSNFKKQIQKYHTTLIDLQDKVSYIETHISEYPEYVNILTKDQEQITKLLRQTSVHVKFNVIFKQWSAILSMKNKTESKHKPDMITKHEINIPIHFKMVVVLEYMFTQMPFKKFNIDHDSHSWLVNFLPPRYLGEYYYAIEQYFNAFQILKTQNSYFALSKCGYLYEHGLGVKQDKKKAFECFKDSVTISSHNLALIYYKGEVVEKDEEKAISLLLLDVDNKENQFNLHVIFYDMNMDKKTKTLDFLKMSAEQGHVDAQFTLSYFLDRQKWLKIASLNGDIEAQYELGRYYGNRFYLLKAANKGHKIAQYYLGMTTSDDMRHDWLLKSANQGYEYAINALNNEISHDISNLRE
jgi:hypothetical protein